MRSKVYPLNKNDTSIAMIIYHIALTAHIVGVTIAAGATFIDFVLYRQFRRNFSNDESSNKIIEGLLGGLQRLMGAGMGLIILSGVVMMIYLHQVWGEQVWFRVKMGVLLLILINQLAFRRRLHNQWKKLLNEGFDKISRITKNITTVQVFQMLFLVVIFTLSVFKFN